MRDPLNGCETPSTSYGGLSSRWLTAVAANAREPSLKIRPPIFPGTDAWLKIKNPIAPAAKRESQIDWSKRGRGSLIYKHACTLARLVARASIAALGKKGD